MDVNFHFTEASTPEPVYFEEIFAEKPAGGIVLNPSADLAPTTPLYLNDKGQYTSVAPNESSEPVALLGSPVYAGEGDQMSKIVLGAVVRKASAVDTTATLNGSIKYV